MEFLIHYQAQSVITFSLREGIFHENQFWSGGGVLCVLALALVAVLFISPGSAWTTYYLIRTGHGGNDVVQTVPEGGSKTFKISFQARHIPHSEWTNVHGNPATCFRIPATFYTGHATFRGHCYVLIPESRRIRPVIPDFKSDGCHGPRVDHYYVQLPYHRYRSMGP